MKKLFISSLSLLPAFAFAATDATVVQSGNWSIGSTWASGEKPAQSDDNIYNITFGGDDLFLQLHTGGGYTAQRQIYIALGDGVKTATVANSNTSDDKTSVLYLDNLKSGDTLHITDATGHTGKLHLAAGTALNAGVNVYLETNLINTNSWNANAFNGHLHVKAGTKDSPVKVVRFSGTGSLTIYENSVLEGSGAFNFQGSDSVVTTEANSLFKAFSVKLEQADISGKFVVTGVRPHSSASNSYDFYVSNKVVFRAGSSLQTTNVDINKARPVIAGAAAKFYSYMGERQMDLATRLQLSGGATFVMNSANAMKVGGQNKQNILISGYAKAVSGEDQPITDSPTTATIKIGEDADTGAALKVDKNTIDNLAFYEESTLKLFLNGNELLIDNVVQEGATDQKFHIVIEDDILKGNLTINNFNGISDEAVIRQYLSMGSAIENLYVDVDNSVVSIYTVVPEPAEWAAIFGAIALAFIVYRKRR